MRIGAILASGGCRTLRWTAMSGVALALGAGQAAAQSFTVDESFGDNGVTIVAAATEGEEMPVTVTVRAKVDPPADPADDQAGRRTVTVYLQARLFNPGEDGYEAQNQAEDSDYAFHEAESERKIEFPSDTDGQFVEVSTTYTGYTLQDPDAENEVFKVTANLSGAMTGARDAAALIDDDETQLRTDPRYRSADRGGADRSDPRGRPRARGRRVENDPEAASRRAPLQSRRCQPRRRQNRYR